MQMDEPDWLGDKPVSGPPQLPLNHILSNADFSQAETSSLNQFSPTAGLAPDSKTGEASNALVAKAPAAGF
jgi:hypothetical protein